MRPLSEIVSIYFERRSGSEGRRGELHHLCQIYNGDIAVPLPEMGRNESPAVANLLKQGIDQMSMRIASVLPDIDAPPVGAKPGSTQAQERANARRRAWYSMWEHNRMSLQLRQRARWLVAYAHSPVVLMPDVANRQIRWEPRNPLSAYLGAPSRVGDITPTDAIFVDQKPWGWLRRRYPAQTARIARPEQVTDGDLFDVLTYVDENELQSILLAKVSAESNVPYFSVSGGRDYGSYPAAAGRSIPEAMRYQRLEAIEHRAGTVPVVAPGAISLDYSQGWFEQIQGMYLQQAELQALSVINVKKGTFPDIWLETRPNEAADVVATADPLRGEVGIVKGGNLVFRAPDPQFVNTQMQNQLEYAQRQTAGIPAEFGGQATTNVRTGRRGAQLLSATIDFPIQEYQQLLAVSLTEENRVAAALDRAWFGGRTKHLHVGWKGARGKLDYDPASTWETDECSVSYPLAGADESMLVIGGLQRVGAGTFSKDSFMRIDPLVEDPEAERDKMVREGLEAAFLSSIQSQAADPAGPYQPTDLARIVELVSTNEMELFEAVQQVQTEAQERQAKEAEAMAPETMPGLSPPGAGAESPTAIPPAQPSAQNLSKILMSLRGPRTRLPEERPA